MPQGRGGEGGGLSSSPRGQPALTRGGNVRRVLLGVVLALMATVIVGRGFALLRHGAVPGAHGERRWYRWAFREPGLPALFSRVEQQLHPGERVILVISRPIEDRAWWLSMAQYYLPAQWVTDVRFADDVSPDPGFDMTTVRLWRDNRIDVRRSHGDG
jgi:hypothetical protein